MATATISPHLRLKKDSQEVSVTYQKDGREHTRVYELILDADSLDKLGANSTGNVARYVESILLPQLAHNFDRFESAVRMDLEIDLSSARPRQFSYATSYTGDLTSGADRIQDIFNGTIPAAPPSSPIPPRNRSFDPADIKTEPSQADLKGKSTSQALPKQSTVQTTPKNVSNPKKKGKKKKKKKDTSSSGSSSSNSTTDSSSEQSSTDSSRKKKNVSSDSGSSSSSESESSSD